MRTITSGRRFALLVCLAIIALAGPKPPARVAPPLGRDEDLLAVMNAPLARECLEASTRLQQWRDEYRAMREAVEAARKGEKPPPREVVDKLRGWVQGVDEFIDKASARFRELTLVKRRVEQAKAKLAEAQEKVRAMPFDPKDSPYRTREEFERAMLDKLELEGLADLAGAYHDEVFAKIEALKDPAQTAGKLFGEMIARKVLENPVEWNGLTLHIKNFNVDNPSRSPFAKDPGLDVELAYAGGIMLEASGLYFDRDGRPVFDGLKVRTDLRSAVTQAAGPLTKQVMAGLPLPLTVEEVEPVDFKGDGAARGALRVRVRFALVEFLKGMEARATLLITPKEIKVDGEVGFAEPTITVPIGSTPLAFRGIDVRVDVNRKQVSVGSIISTTTGDPRALGLDVKAAFAIPLKEITMTGRLLLAGQPVGDVEGTISAEKISGRIDIPCKDGSNPLPIGELLTIHGDFELNREGLSSDAKVCLFKARESKMKLRIAFSGDGSLELQEGFELLGVEASAGMSAAFTPGFKELTMTAFASVDVNLEVIRVGASVQVDASTARREAVRVIAAALGAKVEFTVKDLSQLTPDYLAAQLLKELPDLFDRLTAALLELKDRSSQLLAQAEEDLRNDVSAAAKRVGLDALRTPSPAFDKAIGEVAKGAKKAVEAGVKSRERAAEWVKQMGHDPIKALQGTIDSLWSDLRGIFDPKEQERIREKATDAENELRKAKARKKKAQEEENRIQARLGELLRALYRGEGNITQAPGPVMPGRRVAATGLFVRVGYPACAAAGDEKDQPGTGKDALLSFTFQTGGFRTGGGAGDHDSDVANGYSEFLGLRDPEGTPRARISIPDFRHGSDLQARRLLHEKIAALVEKYVPGVEIEGRFHERALAVFNDTNESVTVWVLAWTRPKATDWVWSPAPPEQPERALAFRLRPGQRLPLLKEKALNAPEEKGRVSGAKVRLWAKSELGMLWEEYRGKDLFLVDERDSCDQSVYYAEKMETYHHTLRPPPGPRTIDVRVPPVTGMSLAQARTVLAAVGLGLATEQPDPRRLARYHDEDQVVGQTPAAHTADRPSIVARGATVRLSVNVRVPIIARGTPLNQALQSLHEHNLLGQYRAGADMSTPVAGQGIMPAWTAPWSTVSLVLMVRVPPVERQPVDRAVATLRREGFPVRDVRGEVVLRQVPAGNSWADPNALPEVVLTVGVTVPNLIGITSQQALGVLRDKGLTGSITREHREQVSDARAGKTLVSRQSVQGVVAVGAQVQLEVTVYVAIRGDVVGMWVCPELKQRHKVDVISFNRDGTLRVRRGDRWLAQSTRWSYTGDTLVFGLIFRSEVEAASYSIRGPVRWLNKDHFHLTVDGKEWCFKRAGPM